MASKRTWAEIDLSALECNMKTIRKFTSPEAMIMCVVKADAYGHGALQVAKTVLANGASWLAVSMLDEAVELRNAGITAPILILSDSESECADVIAQMDIRQGVFSYEIAQKLSEAAVKAGKKIKIHLKIDTGMGRIGFSAEQAPEAAEIISKMEGIEIEGIFTHFAVADELNEKADLYTKAQFDTFCKVCDIIENEKHIYIPIKHASNSAAILRFPHMHLNMVRAGILLYGLWPSEGLKNCGAAIEEVMTLKSAVSYVKETDAGQYISYGCTFCTDKRSIIATIPVGYADGYARSNGNKGIVFHIKSGKTLPIAGRICMDQIMIDATDTKECGSICPGDEVILFGKHGSSAPTADDIAAVSGTINYEVLCGVGRRVPRIYIKDGSVVQTLNRLAVNI